MIEASSFAHVLDRGGMRRAWLRGRENVHKRYLIHVAGFNLGILMRALVGRGTPREAASAKDALLFIIQTDAALAIAIFAVIDGAPAMLVALIAPETFCSDATYSPDCYANAASFTTLTVGGVNVTRWRQCRPHHTSGT